ncbi:hypothetical protein SAMN05892883_3700 [Jatrophihabitans sp. GAS493]|uniref:hypothetical protein n=1 Tax=Jatrophihabitans sp. GAS493 TaxID=1907575 RepID=UPI000BB6D62C|nr:hypothetical protein [Jatrophihabitans sp. GAS493]SOD74514.1 hypothetical protein SAMN05892883_3700 [Jatrophihabitans sp. GAS493]
MSQSCSPAAEPQADQYARMVTTLSAHRELLALNATLGSYPFRSAQSSQTPDTSSTMNNDAAQLRRQGA